MSFLNKIADADKGGTVPGVLTGVLVDSPAVTEYLAVGAYPDGTARERAVISIFIEEGRVKCCLNDRDTGRTLWRSAGGIEACIGLIDDAIAEGTADWRRAAGSGRGPGKRKS